MRSFRSGSIDRLSLALARASRYGESLPGREDVLPVPLHVHHDPPPRRGFVEGTGQAADGGPSVVRVLASGVGMMDDQAEAGAGAGARGGVPEHLVVAVGIAERGDGPAADEPGNPDRLAGAVVDELHL